jgi:hypothetical protein
MKINDANFRQAVEIISKSTSKVSVSFNVPIRDSYSSVYPIILTDASPSLVKDLMSAGYSIGICSKGAYVDKF